MTRASYLRPGKVGLVDCDPDLVPELTVSDLATSQHFWCELIGFTVAYARLNEGFAYLTLGKAHLMLDQVDMGRTWATADLQPPLGRGVNLQVGVPSLDEVLRRLRAADWPLFSAAEERRYSRGTDDVGVRQCLVQDQDGYLVRPQQSLGTRLATG